MTTLAEVFPELAKQWDYEKNGDLTPETVSYGSNKKVWWICSKCGQSYQKRIGNRTAPSKYSVESDKCPICLGRVIIPGVNSLKAKYPDIIAREWDFEKNTIDPDTISPHYRQKMWWRCPIGHSYDSLPGNKIQHTGGDCPYCSSNRLCKETSLGYVNPELAKEWHPTKNGVLTPFDVFASTNKYIWWQCPTCGHEWRSQCSNRNVGKRGCPNCAKGRSSSVPEQLLYRCVKKFFPEAISRHIVDKEEIDVFIPSLNIGFEYDGQRYHNQSKLPKDIAKTKRLISKGIILYRFREGDCPDISVPKCTVIKVNYSPDYSDLEVKLNILLKQLLPNTAVSINFDKVINEVRAELDCLPYERSFEAAEEMKRKEGINPVALWDYEANAPLTPKMVTTKSAKKVNWICPINPKHKWRSLISSISNGWGCPHCAKRYQYSTAEWIEQAKEVHGDKYNYCMVEYTNSENNVKIICPKHGVFEQNPSMHLSGHGCPYCAHQKFHQLESLALLRPDIASEWDYERNNDSGFTPDTIGIDTRRKFWWHCNNGCNHSYLATIAFRVSRNSGCAVCHGKQVAPDDTSFAALFPEIAKEWCEENDKKPNEIAAGSDYEALWKCPNPNHPPYRQKVQVRSRGCGCVYCNRYGRKHPKDFEDELKDKHPHIKLLSSFTRMSDNLVCQCKECGHIWKPTGNSVLKGKGCPKCRGGR